jgi:aryl-alcohol dehydrogenase-like predicted oxidoreductase
MRYRVFGQHTGLRVSEFALGTGNFGTAFGHGAEPDEARRIFDGYVEAGGNFIDTADLYQHGEAETMLGDFIQAGRDQLVLASKFSMGSSAASGLAGTGNSRKAMVQCLEASLKRLKTDRIDMYWVHTPDGVTPVDEVMRGLDDLVRAGKIIYIGLSNYAAWRVARAATLAELRGWAPLAGVQMEYSLAERTVERDLLPMAESFGIGAATWAPLAGGVLTAKYRRGETGRQEASKSNTLHPEDSPQRIGIVDMLETIARETSSNPGRVALAWLLAKGVFPILGPRTRTQLDDNLGAALVRLTPEQVTRLDDVSSIALGFPHDFLIKSSTLDRLSGSKLGLVDMPAAPVI